MGYKGWENFKAGAKSPSVPSASTKGTGTVSLVPDWRNT